MPMNKFLRCIPLLLVASCVTTGEPDTERISRAVKEAATFGTQEAVREHPEWRPHFVLARTELDLLAQMNEISVDSLLDVANRMPVQELSSDRARLIVGGAKLTIAIAGWSNVKLKQTEQVRPVVIALRDGIDAGLMPRPPIPAPAAGSYVPK